MGELQADVGVEPAARDFVQHLMVELGAVAGFIGVGDVLAEVIDGNAQTCPVDGLRDPQGIFDLGAGYKTAGQAPPHGGAFSHPAQPAAL